MQYFINSINEISAPKDAMASKETSLKPNGLRDSKH
jgi:hypothetical protein